MQPKNMVSGRKIAVSRLFPGWNRLFAVFFTLPEPVLQPNSLPVIRCERRSLSARNAGGSGVSSRQTVALDGVTESWIVPLLGPA